MAKIILNSQNQLEESTSIQKTGRIELDLQNYAQIYPRVSTPEQKKNVSAEMQQDKSFALNFGWPEDKIILDTRDLGVSGQLRMEDRLTFNDMNRRIANGTIKTVIAAQVDRLFRDRWGKEYSKFMEICFTYGVKVVTLTPDRKAIDFIYDFSVSWHIDQFRRECEAAWKFIEKHIGRMKAAKDELGTSGKWTGGALAAGIIVDRREFISGTKNPDYRKYIPYEPHAAIVEWLFDRYWELRGNIGALHREIARREYLFPAFDDKVDAEIVTRCLLTKVYDEQGAIKGYTISDVGLRNLLANPFYAGYIVYKGRVIGVDDRLSIVKYGKFIYAFNRLSPTNLDGTLNEFYLERISKYAKKYTGKQAILNGFIESGNADYRIYPKTRPIHAKGVQTGSAETLYGFYPRKYGNNRTAVYMITTSEVDQIFLNCFIAKLQNSEAFDDFLDYEEVEKRTQSELLEDVDRDIKAVEGAMKRIEKQIAMGELTNKHLLKIANKSYQDQAEELERLQNRKKEITSNVSHAQKRRTYQQLMKEAGERWNEVVTPEDMLLMIDAFVEKITLLTLAPHFYKVSIYWRDPEWGLDEAICARRGNPSIHWKMDEDNILRVHYTTVSKQELLQMLPNRSWHSIQHRAWSLAVRRINISSDVIPQHFSYQDLQFMEECGITEGMMHGNDGQGAKFVRWC